MFRQGDILLVPSKIPEKAEPGQRGKGSVVLAVGEATGHCHEILEGDVRTYVDESTEITRNFVRVLEEAGVDLVHPEHDVITVPPGDYEVRRQREYTPEAIRRVSD